MLKNQILFEFKTVILKRSVALTVFLIPLLFVGLAYVAHPEGENAWRSFAASWSVLVVVFSVIFAVPMVVADRRDRLVYKRLLTSSLSKTDILVAGMFPYAVIAFFQIVLVGLALAKMGGLSLVHPVLFFVGAIILSLTVCIAGLALGAIAESAERAQWTVLPLVVVIAIAVNFLPASTSNEMLRKVLYFAPGGSFVDVFNISFGGESFATELFGLSPNIAWVASLALCLAWGAIACVVARDRFRWDSR